MTATAIRSEVQNDGFGGACRRNLVSGISGNVSRRSDTDSMSVSASSLTKSTSLYIFRPSFLRLQLLFEKSQTSVNYFGDGIA